MIRRQKDRSRAINSHFVVPAPTGLEYLPYQAAGIEYAYSRSRVLIADEMGLGKTIQAIGVVNAADRYSQHVLVICPSSVKYNWVNEFTKWTTNGLTAGCVEGRTGKDPQTNVVVINYELLSSHQDLVRSVEWDNLIIDEAHYLKSGKSDRTAQVFGRKRAKDEKPALRPIPFKRIMMLTGTPILNNPKELWPLIQALDPAGLGSDWFGYARRYCQLIEITRFNPSTGKDERIGWKWDGADNLQELQTIMRDRFMIRRLKKDVLKDLPPKTRQVIVLEAKKGLTKLLERDRLFYDEYVKQHGEDVPPPEFTESAKVRKEVAIAKIPYLIDYLKEVLDETDKVVFFAHHHEVLDAVKAAFGHAATGFDGRTNSTDREMAINQFQDPTSGKRLFAGGIQAAGIGVTLTAARIAVFGEMDWVPGNNTQAEDRLHRIGQKENVLIRYVVLRGSNDERIVEKCIHKQEISERTLDR